MDDTKIHRGRPSKAEQLEIQKKIWPYFEEQYRVGRTAEETGINKKTVRKHFRILYEQFRSKQDVEFFERCKISKGRTLLALDTCIVELESEASVLKDGITAAKGSLTTDKKWIFAEYRKLMVTIADLELQKNNLESSPTGDISLRNYTNDILKDLEDQREDGGRKT